MANEQGVILEAGEGWAIILLPGGDYRRIKTREYLEPGQLYRFRTNNTIKYVSAAAVLLIMVIASLDFLTVTAWAHISPGIDLGLNRWDRVVSVEATHTAAQIDIKDRSLIGRDLNQAINMIVQEQVRGSGPAGGKKSRLSVSLSLKNEQDHQKKEKLFSIIDASLKDSVAKTKGKPDAVKVVRKGDELRIVEETVDSGNSNMSNSNGQQNRKIDKPAKDKKEQKLQQTLNNLPAATPSADNARGQNPGQVKKESVSDEGKATQNQPAANRNPKKVDIKKDGENNGRGGKQEKQGKQEKHEKQEKTTKPEKNKDNNN